MDEGSGSIATFDSLGLSADVNDVKGASLHLKDRRRFYAPSQIMTVAVHLPYVVAGAASGELFFLEVQGDL